MNVLNVKGPFGGLNPPITCQRQKIYCPRVLWQRRNFLAAGTAMRTTHKIFAPFCTVSSGVQNFNLSTAKFKDFRVSTEVAANREVKVRVDVSGTRTQEVFDDVFAKLVKAAQPIPGFRRVKGGKTPDIPKDVLLQIIGPSKVNKKTIFSVINATIAEFVAKEGLNVTGDLRVEQSYDDIEATFVPGKEFSFEAFICLQQTIKS